MTARLAGCAGVAVLPQPRQQVEFTSQFKTDVMNKKENSFADRVDLMGRAAEDLRSILAIVEAEAKAMAQAQQRFAARSSAKRPAKSAE